MHGNVRRDFYFFYGVTRAWKADVARGIGALVESVRLWSGCARGGGVARGGDVPVGGGGRKQARRREMGVICAKR